MQTHPPRLRGDRESLPVMARLAIVALGRNREARGGARACAEEWEDEMIEKTCETCEDRIGDLQGHCWPCMPTDLRDWRPSRAALEAEVERLEEERDAAIARAAEERAARSGLEEQLSEAERRRDELRAQVALLRAACAAEMRELVAVYRGNGNDLGAATIEARLRALIGGAKEGGGA